MNISRIHFFRSKKDLEVCYQNSDHSNYNTTILHLTKIALISSPEGEAKFLNDVYYSPDISKLEISDVKLTILKY